MGHLHNGILLNHSKEAHWLEKMAEEKDCQGTCIKDPWAKPKWGRIEGGRKWRQLYLNNNEK